MSLKTESIRRRTGIRSSKAAPDFISYDITQLFLPLQVLV